MKANKGFTLLEILLSLAIIAILVGLSAPVYQSLQTNNELDLATMTMVETLRRGQALSQAVKEDSSWGVHVASSTITLFAGSSYASRNTSLDETYEYSKLITASGSNEFIFEKLTGKTASGTVTLTISSDESEAIEVNELGRVSH